MAFVSPCEYFAFPWKTSERLAGRGFTRTKNRDFGEVDLQHEPILSTVRHQLVAIPWRLCAEFTESEHKTPETPLPEPHLA